MFKKKPKQQVSQPLNIDYTPFINSFTNKNKRALAVALIAGTDTSEYQTVRVQEIAKLLSTYQDNPTTYEANKYACISCGIN